MKCPQCGKECDRDEVDIGVGIQVGPWGCFNCGWSEQKMADEDDDFPPKQDISGDELPEKEVITEGDDELPKELYEENDLNEVELPSKLEDKE